MQVVSVLASLGLAFFAEPKTSVVAKAESSADNVDQTFFDHILTDEEVVAGFFAP